MGTGPRAHEPLRTEIVLPHVVEPPVDVGEEPRRTPVLVGSLPHVQVGRHTVGLRPGPSGTTDTVARQGSHPAPLGPVEDVTHVLRRVPQEGVEPLVLVVRSVGPPEVPTDVVGRRRDILGHVREAVGHARARVTLRVPVLPGAPTHVLPPPDGAGVLG